MQTAILTERAASLPSLQSNSVSDYFDFSVSIFRGLAAFLTWTCVDRSAPLRAPRFHSVRSTRYDRIFSAIRADEFANGNTIRQSKIRIAEPAGAMAFGLS